VSNGDDLTVKFMLFDDANPMMMSVSAAKTPINRINSGRANVSIFLICCFLIECCNIVCLIQV
jgi:hypothetical protein